MRPWVLEPLSGGLHARYREHQLRPESFNSPIDASRHPIMAIRVFTHIAFPAAEMRSSAFEAEFECFYVNIVNASFHWQINVASVGSPEVVSLWMLEVSGSGLCKNSHHPH